MRSEMVVCGRMIAGHASFPIVEDTPFRLTVLIHRLLLHIPEAPCPSPSSHPGETFLPFLGVLLVSSSLTRSVIHLSPSTSTSTPCTILSSTHSRLPRSRTHFLSPHSHPLGAHTSSKNLMPLGFSPAMRCGDNGSYGFGLKIHDSHSPFWPPFRLCNSYTSTSLISGSSSRTMSRAIQASSQDLALRS